jgi:hypothetical protein
MARTKHHGNKAKKRAFGDGWLWLQSTPSWWTRLMMNRPQRRAAAVWERNATRSADLEAEDDPPHGNKPHRYYW